MHNIGRCHKTALHIAVLCLQTRSLNRMFQELHDGNEWELLGDRKSKGKSQAVSLEEKTMDDEPRAPDQIGISIRILFEFPLAALAECVVRCVFAKG